VNVKIDHIVGHFDLLESNCTILKDTANSFYFVYSDIEQRRKSVIICLYSDDYYLGTSAPRYYKFPHQVQVNDFLTQLTFNKDLTEVISLMNLEEQDSAKTLVLEKWLSQLADEQNKQLNRRSAP
jgi:hypothetical protein